MKAMNINIAVLTETKNCKELDIVAREQNADFLWGSNMFPKSKILSS
jgi:hypothetical protein